MDPSTRVSSSDDSLDMFLMSLAISPDGKTLKTGLFHQSPDEAVKIIQRGITHSDPKLFARGFEVQVNRVLYGIEPKDVNSCKGEEEKECKFLRGFQAKEKGKPNEEVDENIISWHKFKEEETYKVDLEDIREWVGFVEGEKYEEEVEEGWVVTDGQDEDSVDKDHGWVMYEEEDEDLVVEETYKVDLGDFPGWLMVEEIED